MTVSAPLVEFVDESGGRLVVRSGEQVVLLGPSGSGKTALIRRLLGLASPAVPPPRVLRVRGRPVADIAGIAGWVPDGDGVFLSDTVAANVARPAGVGRERPAGDVADALDLVGLAGRAGSPTSALGLHGRRRVALARALAARRPLLVIDGDVDPTLGALLPGLLAQARWVEAVLLATATASETARRAGSVALVAGGRVVAQAPFGDLERLADPDVRGVLTWVTSG